MATTPTKWPIETAQADPYAGNYYTYGQGPEFDFFNTIPTQPEPEVPVDPLLPIADTQPLQDRLITKDRSGRDKRKSGGNYSYTADMAQSDARDALGMGSGGSALGQGFGGDLPWGEALGRAGAYITDNAIFGGVPVVSAARGVYNFFNPNQERGAAFTPHSNANEAASPGTNAFLDRFAGGNNAPQFGQRGYSAYQRHVQAADAAAAGGAFSSGPSAYGMNKYSGPGTAGTTNADGSYNSSKTSSGSSRGGVGVDRHGREVGAYGQHTQDVMGRGDGSSSDGNTRVICTELKRQGLISKADWIMDLRFTATHLSPTHVQGYHLFAIPVVRALRKGRWVKFWTWAAQRRANDIAFVTGKSTKRDLQGRAIRYIMEPICWTLGRFVPEQNWASLYEGNPVK